MLPWRELVVVIFQALAQAVINPLFWVVVIFIGWQYRRLLETRRQLFGVGSQQVWKPTLVAAVQGIVGGLVGSLLMVMAGISLSHIGVGYLWALALVLMLISPHLLCFSYSGGIIATFSLIFGVPPIDVPQLMGLVAVLHMVESVLIRFSGHLGAIPVYAQAENGQVVGAFNLQRLWPIPIAGLVLASGVNLPPDSMVAMPNWWPLIRPTLENPGQGVYLLLPVIAALGYGDLALAHTPNQKRRSSAISLAAFSFILLALSVLASYIHKLAILPALFAPLGHEFIIRRGQAVEMQGKPIYVPPRRGVRVLDALEGLPAHAAGIRSGDVVIEVNGIQVNSRADLEARLGETTGRIHLQILTSQLEMQSVHRTRLLTVERISGQPLGLILVPEGLDQPQVRLEKGGWIVRWWRKRRERERSDVNP